MSIAQFEQFRRVVLNEPPLQEQLRATCDCAGFCALLVRLGAERGYEFTVAEIEEALHAGRRAWLERWVY